MRIWYDTEFIDTGTHIELLSIGMVREDGKTYYAVVQDLNLMLKAYNWTSNGEYWLRNNVMNSLPVKVQPKDRVYPLIWDMDHPDVGAIRIRSNIGREIRKFCTEKGTPELWAWYAAYDHVALSQLFGRMLDLPEDMPMYTMDLKQEHRRLGEPKLPHQYGGEHNALADAQWNKVVWQYLMEYQDKG